MSNVEETNAASTNTSTSFNANDANYNANAANANVGANVYVKDKGTVVGKVFTGFYVFIYTWVRITNYK